MLNIVCIKDNKNYQTNEVFKRGIRGNQPDNPPCLRQ